MQGGWGLEFDKLRKITTYKTLIKHPFTERISCAKMLAVRFEGLCFQ